MEPIGCRTVEPYGSFSRNADRWQSSPNGGHSGPVPPNRHRVVDPGVVPDSDRITVAATASGCLLPHRTERTV